MKRFLTSLAILLVIFIIFALVVGQLRGMAVYLRVPFLPTIHTTVEALAYASYLVGFVPVTLLALTGTMAVARRYRSILAEQRKTASSSAHAGPASGGSNRDEAEQNPSH